MAEETDAPKNEEFLREAFASEQTCLVASLRSSSRIVHAGDRGEVNEQHFIDFLRHYLPNRYTVEKAIVIDSLGQVVNTGDEASSVPGGLRGGFCEGVTERGGLVRNEGTQYEGNHWIECFIVKQGACVARSGEFVVNID